jgi:branched-chain amino acid transport system permease protein
VALFTLSPETKAASFFISAPIWPINVVEWPLLPSLILGGLLTALIGFCIGAPALRLHGDYLLIVTFGFSEIIRLLRVNLPMVCNGAMGLKGFAVFKSNLDNRATFFPGFVVKDCRQQLWPAR